MSGPLNETLNETLVKAIERAKMTHEDLAEKVGCTVTTIRNTINRKYARPSWRVLEGIAAALDDFPSALGLVEGIEAPPGPDVGDYPAEPIPIRIVLLNCNDALVIDDNPGRPGPAICRGAPSKALEYLAKRLPGCELVETE